MTSTGILLQKYHFLFELNPKHPVYQGHFPGNPVVPGVCQVQIIHELLSDITGSPMRLLSADNIKYLALMVPASDTLLHCDLVVKHLDEGQIAANASLYAKDKVFIKFKGIFIADGH